MTPLPGAGDTARDTHEPGVREPAPTGGPAAPPAGDAPAPTATPASSIADGRERRLDPRYVQLHKVIGWILAAMIAAGNAVALLTLWLVSDSPGWLLLLMAAGSLVALPLLAWFLTWWPELEHRHHSYRVDPGGIEIRSGVWWRKVVNVPRSRVQHTDVSQGPLERRYGLGTLRIHTAGTENAQVDLPGLDHADALTIRDHLVMVGEDDAV